MIYHSRVYGKVKISEPVILELIQSKAIQRLKKIEQGGYAPLYTNPRKISTKQLIHKRFEHSSGVFILLRKFGASLEEQIAGLIHDISHGVFSHSTDFVFGCGSTQDKGDKTFKQFFLKSELPKILKKYGYQSNRFLNKKNFPLLENNLPDICADRIDYILMLALIFHEENKKTIKDFIKNLSIKNNHWFFKNRTIAQKFARMFKRINETYLCDQRAAAMHRFVGNFLLYSLRKKYINKKDIFFGTDSLVLKNIKKYKKIDLNIKKFLYRMDGRVNFKNDYKDYQHREFIKSRIIDPLFKKDKKLIRISQVDKKWKKIIKQDLKPKEYFIKFL